MQSYPYVLRCSGLSHFLNSVNFLSPRSQIRLTFQHGLQLWPQLILASLNLLLLLLLAFLLGIGSMLIACFPVEHQNSCTELITTPTLDKMWPSTETLLFATARSRKLGLNRFRGWRPPVQTLWMATHCLYALVSYWTARPGLTDCGSVDGSHERCSELDNQPSLHLLLTCENSLWLCVYLRRR